MSKILSSIDIAHFISAIALLISFLSYLGSTKATKSAKKLEEKLRHIEIDKELDIAWNLLGGNISKDGIFILANISKLNEAKRIITKCIKLEPSYSESYRLFGLYYMGRNRTNDAEKMYMKCIEINKKNYKAYNNLANLYFKNCNFTPAIENYKNSININPNNATAIVNLGNLYRHEEIKEYELSVKYYLEAIDIENDDSITYNHLGIAYKNLNSFENAINAFKNSIELDPTSYLNPYYNLENLYLELNEPNKAAILFQKMLSLDENKVAIEDYIEISESYLGKNFPDKALKFINKALKIDSRNFDALSIKDKLSTI